MNLDRLLLSGALRQTRTILRREGLLLSTFAAAGAIAFGYLIAAALAPLAEAIIEWIAQ